MTERRKPATKQLERRAMNPKTPMTKEQISVVNWMRENIPVKKTKFLHSHVVEYFPGNKAVDLLMGDTSPWHSVKGGDVLDGQLVFDSREKVVEYLDTLLRYKMFHRAKKIPVTDKDKEDRMSWKERKRSREDQEVNIQEDPTNELDKDSEDKSSGGEEKVKEDKVEKIKEDKVEKKKRKIRLDMHLDQIFVDSSDAFVWLYDPIPWYYWIGGGGICLALIVLCIFPLWPKKLRKGTHWIATGGVGFLVVVFLLGLLKYAIFSLLYLLSGRKFRFWILPNLTKDVGFFASFWPIYDYLYTGEIHEDNDRVEEIKESDDVTNDNEKIQHDESDSNESGKSAFEFVEKNKED